MVGSLTETNTLTIPMPNSIHIPCFVQCSPSLASLLPQSSLSCEQITEDMRFHENLVISDRMIKYYFQCFYRSEQRHILNTHASGHSIESQLSITNLQKAKYIEKENCGVLSQIHGYSHWPPQLSLASGICFASLDTLLSSYQMVMAYQYLLCNYSSDCVSPN